MTRQKKLQKKKMSNTENTTFVPAKSEDGKVWFQGDGVSPDETLAFGYFLSAEMIVNQCRGLANIDLHIFPICFLLRHSLELHLKAAIKAT